MVHLLLSLALGMPADTVIYRGRAGDLAVQVPRVEAPDIRVDGSLDESDWARAAILTDFTQFEPNEGIPASQDTDVRVFYGPDAIYFGVLAHDTDPSLIRATLTERDEGVTDDDWVRITLDTFDDNAQAYVFIVNPRGIQADGLWIEGLVRRMSYGPPIDYNPDFLWESAARTTADGWVAEIRIPYVSLRFREAATQRWGINVARKVQRMDYQSTWAPYTVAAANKLELSGSLEGLQGLEPRRLVELNPVVTGRRLGALNGSGDFTRDDFEPAFGLNARYGVTRNLVLDATVNPDFSQVEADADQVAVNQRFALFFPEKRPFFLEGTEVFGTPQQLVYTRSIADPAAGAKLTGKLGAFNAGYLGAVDESPRTLGNGSTEALFNLVRLRRDVGTGSNVGLLYADRSLLDGSGYNRVGALDTRLVMGGRYSLTAQLAGAWTQEQDPAGTPEDLFGPLLAAQLERNGRSFSWQAGLVDVHPDFRARSGFIRRLGDTNVSGQMRYMFYREPGAFMENWYTEVQVRAYYDHEGFWAGDQYNERTMSWAFDFNLRGANWINVALTSEYFDFDPELFQDYTFQEPGGGFTGYGEPSTLENNMGVRFFAQARPLPWLTLNGRGNWGETPIYDEGSRGVETVLRPTAEIRLPFGLLANASFTYAHIDRADGGRFSVAQIPRLKVQYQITPALFIRSIVQYNLEERDALRTEDGSPLWVGGQESTAVDQGEMRYDFLVSYEPSPGTIVYAGFSRLLEGPETYQVDRFSAVNEGLFLKVSYLFRL